VKTRAPMHCAAGHIKPVCVQIYRPMQSFTFTANGFTVVCPAVKVA
jgi:hypothetical protein